MADEEIHSTIYGPELKRDEVRKGTLRRARRGRTRAEAERDKAAHAAMKDAGIQAAFKAFQAAIQSGDPQAIEATEARFSELRTSPRVLAINAFLMAFKDQHDDPEAFDAAKERLVDLIRDIGQFEDLARAEQKAEAERETRNRLLGPLYIAEAEWNKQIDGEESLADKAHALNRLFLHQHLLKGQMLREYAREMGLHVPDLPTNNETDRKKECARVCREYLLMFVCTEAEWKRLKTILNKPDEWHWTPDTPKRTVKAFEVWQMGQIDDNWEKLKICLQVDMLTEHWSFLSDCLSRIESAFGSLEEKQFRDVFEPMFHPLAQRKRSKVRKDSAISMLLGLAKAAKLGWERGAIEQAEKR